MASRFHLTILSPTHIVGAFSCGKTEIDDYLKNRAAIEQQLNLSQVYVLIDDDQRIWAYGTLSPVTVQIEEALLKTIGIHSAPYRSIGGYLLGRMGVDQSTQSKGIGRALVARLAEIAAGQRAVTGGVFLAVDAKAEELVGYYEKLGFHRVAPAPRKRLILPLGPFSR